MRVAYLERQWGEAVTERQMASSVSGVREEI